MENKQTYLTLEDILGKDEADLTAVAQGEFQTAKLGLLPFSAIDQLEFKQAKKDCTIKHKDRTEEVDGDRLALLVIIKAVDKDKRSNFTFADARLLQKLNVHTAEAAVVKLLSPGEIYKMADEIQDLSGFGPKAEQEIEEAVKN